MYGWLGRKIEQFIKWLWGSVCPPKPRPPRGVRPISLKQVKKGTKMAADVQYTYTPDTDPHVVKTSHTWLLNGSQAGVVDQTTNANGLVNFSDIPGAPALKVGDQVTVSTITTDDVGQVSPSIPAGSTVTITSTPPPPTGVTPGTLKQIGQP